MNLYKRKSDKDTCVGESLKDVTSPQVRNNSLLQNRANSNLSQIDKELDLAIARFSLDTEIDNL